MSRAVKICRRKVVEKVDQMCLIRSGDQQIEPDISRENPRMSLKPFRTLEEAQSTCVQYSRLLFVYSQQMRASVVATNRASGQISRMRVEGRVSRLKVGVEGFRPNG